MKADHHQATTGRKHLQGRRQCTLDLTQLVVDVHAYGLETACGGVLARLTGAHCACHDSSQLRCGLQWCLLARCEDGAGDATREALFTQPADHVAQLIVTDGGQPLRGTDATRGVHAHVQRAIALEAEAALGLIDLR